MRQSAAIQKQIEFYRSFKLAVSFFERIESQLQRPGLNFIPKRCPSIQFFYN